MKKVLLLIAVAAYFNVSAAVESTVLYGKEAHEIAKNSEVVRLKNFTKVPNYVKFRNGNELPFMKLESWLNSYYETDLNFGLKLIKVETGKLGLQHYRYQQTVNNVPVELSMYIAHVNNGQIVSVNGELFSSINVNTTPALSVHSALNKALDHVGASVYKWEVPAEEAHLKWREGNPAATYYPKGELVVVNKGGVIDNELVLAYKFNIYAQEPFGRSEIFVDASTGHVVWEREWIHEVDVTGTANTVYSGTQTITSDNNAGSNHRLRETGRGNGVRTFDCGHTTNYTNTDFTNNSNNWTTAEAGLDAHWGAEKTYDYYLNEHGRNSIDGAGFRLDSYVHYDNNFSNAFWDGAVMTYGDGSGNANPFTAIDIAGHEVTHGLTTNTANLVYQAESGALNESFSDIFGISIDFINRPGVADWVLGDDLGFVIRNMANPNSAGDPDTYFGTNWASLTGGDNGGVHTNSGVQNFWFVLLVDGGSGTNDNNDAYTVNSIGLTKAGQVAFRNLTVYLTQSSEYADARFYGIQSAVDLFGGCTPEVQEVTNAWYAVGVGQPYSPNTVSDFDAPTLTSCSAPFTVNFNNLSVNGVTYSWDFGDGGTSTQTTPSYTYTTTGTFTVQLIADGGASCGKDTTTKLAYITVDTNLPCITILPTTGTAQTQTSCTGTIYDSGGSTGQYGPDEDAQITLSPTGASTVDINFVMFDVEAGSSGTQCDYDYIEVYDGPTTASTLIGRYCNNNTPPATISSTGGSMTIVFHSDPGVEKNGFEITWQCQLPNQAPTADFTADVDTTCTGLVTFTDLSNNGPLSWQWNFGDGNSSSQQNPTHQYTANGLYTVDLTATNGIGPDTETKNNYIFVDMPAAPTTTGDIICENATASLSASGSGTLNWYAAATGGTIINTGNTYVTPALSTTTTYYVQDVIAQPTANMGKPNNTGGGANFNNFQYLIFDVFKSMELVSVEVYSGAAGNRTIELRDNLGTVLQSATVNIPTGQQTVNLNFLVSPGVDYQLGVSTTSAIDLYRNNAGTNYPYTLPGIASITKSSAGTNPTGFYYFFYNWLVKEQDCMSPRAAVTATVNICTGLDEVNGTPVFNAYYNTGNNIELSMNNFEKGSYQVTVHNAIGQLVMEEQIQVNSASQREELNMNNQSNGMYVVNVFNDKSYYTVKLIK
ncbi:MAG: M4 family metallopeptidase [Flavobacteriales bacterium]|nr:M4 family metallopeptidase [Flavobacteriales bacterium]